MSIIEIFLLALGVACASRFMFTGDMWSAFGFLGMAAALVAIAVTGARKDSKTIAAIKQIAAQAQTDAAEAKKRILAIENRTGFTDPRRGINIP